MTRARVSPRFFTALTLALLGGCSATHLNLGVTDDAGPSARDASSPSIDAMRADATLPPGVDGGPPPITEPDAWTPVPRPDAWTPPITEPDAWVPPITEPDAWSPTPADAGVPGSDAGPPGVVCGAEICTAPQICCVMFGGPGGGGGSRACSAPADCMGVAASCDGPEDCASGEACCGMRTMGGGATGCVADAMCRFGRLCHADGDCTGRDTCCAFMGTSVCSPFCP
ncbi:MAG: hypothetical protein K1X94_34145 [Sandaracinaceae bacterium]|nr:hypothetical protein [Sandaracinaceae bacterium]